MPEVTEPNSVLMTEYEYEYYLAFQKWLNTNSPEPFASFQISTGYPGKPVMSDPILNF